jgi:5-hydroxyisourate hydrolase
MPGGLTIHVLDGSRGVPAGGLLVDLFRVGVRPSDRHHLKTAVTDESGGAGGPLVEGSAFVAGGYELLLHVGRYFRGLEGAAEEPSFLDVVPVRFAVAASTALHLGLLIGPWSYTVYRGR